MAWHHIGDHRVHHLQKSRVDVHTPVSFRCVPPFPVDGPFFVNGSASLGAYREGQCKIRISFKLDDLLHGLIHLFFIQKYPEEKASKNIISIHILVEEEVHQTIYRNGPGSDIPKKSTGSSNRLQLFWQRKT